MELIKKLNKIQQELSVPKNQKNSFGNYMFRSAEDILEAVKPLLGECILTMSDKVANIGNHNYIQATAALLLGEEKLFVEAFAREAETQKGMSDSQSTGATSSYARKYALNGLFAIDDTKDADTMNNAKPASKPASGFAQNSVNKLNNYKKDNDDLPWVTDKLFEEAIEKSVKVGVFKIGIKPTKVMEVLRMRYKVAQKYEAMVNDTINKYATAS